ncbi:hypothetical protein JM79_3231 [Gramella sp. Hel_I_59]|uniref:hypothetical protein n=1 Tax=Gramella sp. Hel_I_59 TaxID=1249978 RepID=UPI001152722F|nr:hypothetical protein [Gramella sp. Hel_I_59]TQI72274.1 hypothetical protein JM79_3231 [Gramella sp. Hel_I_59]
MKNLKVFFPFLMAFFNIDAKTLMDNKEKLELSDEQKAEFDAKAGKEGFSEKYLKDFNTEIGAEEEQEEDDAEIQALAAKYMSEDSDGGEGEEEEEEGAGAPDESKSAKAPAKTAGGQSKKLLTTMDSRIKKLEAEKKMLAGIPEGDESVETIKASHMKNANIRHSKTHLFAQDHSYNAFEGRPWNEAARQALGGHQITAETNWTETANIDKLNSDIQAYFRKEDQRIHDTMLDGLEMKKYVELISGVSDEYIHTQIVTGEITQSLKSKFLPKNKVKFVAEKGKVRDIQIDMLFKGYQLKKLEKSYLKHIASLGITDSDPHKMTYVYYVVGKIMERARKEDKIVMGRGVYFKDEERDTPASFMNNFSGFLKLYLDARGVKFRPFKMGKPTKLNVHDYVKKMCENLPYDVSILPDLQFVLSPSWKRAYNDSRRTIYGGNTDYKGDTDTVDDFSNIELVTYDQMEGEDFMYITTKDNEYALTDKPDEDGFIQFRKGGSDPRDIQAYGDYKLSAYVAMFGRKQYDLPENSYENQLVFSNDVELLTNTYVPVPANESVPSLADHQSIVVGANNTEATDITNFADATPGERIYILGNADNLKSTVKNNANIILEAGDFVASNGSLLVLQALDGGKFIEIERKMVGAEEEEQQVVLAANATTANAEEGNSFVTSANTQATALTTIEGAVPGERYTITGGSNDNATTIANGGNFFLSADIALTTGKFLTVELIGGKFREIARG